MKHFKIKFEYKLTLGYIFFGVLWILFSDKLVNSMATNSDLRASFQLFKGWFYVLVTATFFFFFIRRHLRRLRESETALSQKNLELTKTQNKLETRNIELQSAKEKAEESNRLKTAFLNNISHEFRTPMNAILGFSSMLVRPNINEEQRSIYARYVDQSTHQLLEMITDIIEISQVQQKQITLHETSCNFEDMMNQVYAKAQKKIVGKNINIEIFGDFCNFTAKIDCYKLTRILDHIIDNAIKFTSKGKIGITCNQEENRAVFSITDTGIGIPNDIKEKIFDAFRQEELGLMRNYGGNGLGLTLVKAYTEILNGKINIESSRDKGTKVFLSVPFQQDEKNTKDELIHVNQTFYGKNVLIADDEIFNYYYLRELLDLQGINSLHASNGKEALDLFEDNKDIDLILMDIKMPVMDGYEATKKIRTLDSMIPIIAQSAYVLEKDKLTGQFNDVLPKPIIQTDLNHILIKYLA